MSNDDRATGHERVAGVHVNSPTALWKNLCVSINEQKYPEQYPQCHPVREHIFSRKKRPDAYSRYIIFQIKNPS